MKAEEIREGDIVEIDYITEFTKEHINEGKALVIWKGFNHQPLVRKLNTRSTIWACYNQIAKVLGHIDIEGYIDKALEQDPKTGHWIPVSERLPEAGEYIGDVAKYYLVQNEYGDMLVARYTHSGYWEQIYQLNPIGDEIVAWMPLPEPYKAESEDKE